MVRWLALIAIAQQVSCSGGGGSSTRSNADPSLAITVSVSPSSSQISANGSVQFSAIVQNASNPAVNWQVNGLAGGNSSIGTIAPSGAGTATYMAPAKVSAPLTVTVTAVLQADATQFGAATVTINPQPGTQISVSPANPSVVAGTSQQFAANVQNGPQAVIWEVNGLQGGSDALGKISSSSGSVSAIYTAPTTIPSPPAVTITAILETDLSISGSTVLTIVAPLVSVTISPSTANVVSGQTLDLSASVKNSSAGVIWQVNGVTDGNAADGTISPSGTYTATYSAPSVASPLTVSITAGLQTDSSVFASIGVTVVPLDTFTGVYSWRNDNNLTGQNSQEIMLTPSSVSGKTNPFGKLFGCTVDGAIFAQPLYVRNVTIPSQATHNVVYVATENDSVYAFDADESTCQVLWQVSFVNPAAAVTTVPAADISGQTDIVPKIGITGTPVIDPTTATLYVVAKTKNSAGATPVYKQELHALDLATGAERTDSPAIVQATVSGTGDGSVSGQIFFDPLHENQRSALLLAGGNVYVAFDSYDDTPPFHGWLFAYSAGNLKTAPAVFISTRNGSNGGIGESGAAPSSDASGNVFVVTSDGTFDVNTGGVDYAETMLKLQINAAVAGFTVADSFTPFNEFTLNFPQKHFGSTGVLLLPNSALSSVPLAIAGNELGNLYLLNRNSLGGFNGPIGPDNIVQTLTLSGSIFDTPGYWIANNTVYLAASGDNLRALPLTSGKLNSPLCSASPKPCSTDTFPLFGASPVISWDGNNASSGIVWALDTSGYATSVPTILHAYDANNLGTELYSSSSVVSDAPGLAVKFAVPTVANGKVYVGTQTELSVFGLLP